MKKKRFSPEQIAAILKDYDNGKQAQEKVREYCVSKAAYYKWRERYTRLSLFILNYS
jgi:putative transposase